VLGAPNTAASDVQLVTGAATDDLSTEIRHGKLRAMTGLLPTWARGSAKWYMHRTILADITAIEVSSVALVTPFSDGTLSKIMGYPVVEVDAMVASSSVAASTKCLALGDLRKSWILGDRRSVTLDTSEHYAFNTDQLALRITARIAFLMAQGNGMVAYKSGT
jgi:HK97 family phage major capsid protein